MARPSCEKRWLQKFEDSAFKTRVFTISKLVWEKRATMPYSDVLRAKVMILALDPKWGSVGRTKDFAEQVGLSPGNRWHYFTRDVEGWIERMAQRIGLKSKTGNTKTTPRRRPLSHVDLVWIGEFLKNYPNGSLTTRLKLLRGKALHDKNFEHLSRLPRSTFWDHRYESEALATLAEEARKNCRPKRLRSSSTASERDRRIVLPEFIEPEAAVVIPLTPVQPEKVVQWTGNPF